MRSGGGGPSTKANPIRLWCTVTGGDSGRGWDSGRRICHTAREWGYVSDLRNRRNPNSKPLRGSEGGMKKNPTVVYPTNTSAAQAHPPSRTNINKALTSNGFRAPRPRPQPQPTYMYPTIPTQMPTTGALEKQLSFYFSIENLSE
eukprot:1355230-Amorphochlora_amoeboformis.AAC.1